MVYFIRAGGADYVKIGSAKAPWIRLAGFQVGCPLKLELECVLPGGRRSENYFHRNLQERVVRGEWFALSKKEVAPVRALAPSGLDVSRIGAFPGNERRAMIRMCEAWEEEADEEEISRQAWQAMENSSHRVLF